MVKELFAFNRSDSRELKRLAQERRTESLESLQIEYPGKRLPALRGYYVLPLENIGKPFGPDIGALALNSGDCLLLRIAKDSTEASFADQIIFHKGLIDGKRVTVKCFNCLSRDINVNFPPPAPPDEPFDKNQFYWAIQDTFGDLFIIKEPVLGSHFQVATLTDQTITSTTFTPITGLFQTTVRNAIATVAANEVTMKLDVPTQVMLFLECHITATPGGGGTQTGAQVRIEKFQTLTATWVPIIQGQSDALAPHTGFDLTISKSQPFSVGETNQKLRLTAKRTSGGSFRDYIITNQTRFAIMPSPLYGKPVFP